LQIHDDSDDIKRCRLNVWLVISTTDITSRRMKSFSLINKKRELCTVVPMCKSC
jgi:hypothetical protein